METKRIRCPKCGVVLEVKNSNNEPIRTFRCPRCATGLQVVFQTEDTTTVLGVKLQAKSRPRLIYGGQEYELKEGRNVVGRKIKTGPSPADVPIDTPDCYMSRQDAVIMVSALEGGGMKAVLSMYQNKNGLSVDGQRLEPGDEVRLMDGCRITMAETTLTFKG